MTIKDSDRREPSSGKEIWVLHHYADPPNGHWTGTYDLYKFLVRRGYKVTVFSSSFSHYTRRDDRLRREETCREEYFNGMRFVFVKTSPYFSNDVARALNMLMYALRTYRIGCRYQDKPDVIVGSSPHPLCALAALFLSRRKKARFFFEVHDLWPQFLIEIGALSKRNPIAVVLRAIEKLCLRKADKILTLWPRMSDYIEQRGIPRDKVVWMPMGVDFSEVMDQDKRLDGGDFVVMYRGRFGLTNRVTVILQAALILQNQGCGHIRFVLVGEGPERENLVAYAQKSGLKNVEFRDFMPKDQLRKDMSKADVLIGSLPDVPHFQKYGMISTKLLEYLSSKRPVIFATNIEKHLVHEAQAGIVVPPENPAALAHAILQLASLRPEERIRMGENGLKYVRENHNLMVIADRLESLL